MQRFGTRSASQDAGSGTAHRGSPCPRLAAVRHFDWRKAFPLHLIQRFGSKTEAGRKGHVHRSISRQPGGNWTWFRLSRAAGLARAVRGLGG